MSTNLSDMFGGSAKGGNLSGLLPPRPRPGAAVPPPAARPPAAPPAAPPPAKEDQEAYDDNVTPEETAADEATWPEPKPEPAPAPRQERQARQAPAVGGGRGLVEPAPAPREARPRVGAARQDAVLPARTKKAPRRTRREAAPVVPTGLDDTTQVSVYLLPAAKNAAKRLRTEQGVLNAEIVFDAIDAMQGRLDKLVQAMQYEPRGDDSLFPARSTRRRARTRRQTGQPSRTLWTLQVTPAEHEVLDDLVSATGANGISQLISAAVEAYLLEEADDMARRA